MVLSERTMFYIWVVNMQIKKKLTMNLDVAKWDVLCVTLQGCIFRLARSHFELTKDYALTRAYVKIFRCASIS